MSNNPSPKKSLGQHWLNDEESLLAMCEAAELNETDTVLEIGPGLGSLTRLLVEGAEQVIAVEFDANLAEILPTAVRAQNLRVITSDILSFDFISLPPNYKIIANIPYYLTSNLIRVTSETPNPPSSATILVQKEVAVRVAAKPGDMSILSITAQYYWEVSLGPVVEAELFSPPPKVDSQILILKRRTTPIFQNTDTTKLFKLVKAGFAQRRKTLLNSLSGGLHQDKAEISEICAKAGIDPGRRAQTLSMDEWHDLYQAFNT